MCLLRKLAFAVTMFTLVLKVTSRLPTKDSPRVWICTDICFGGNVLLTVCVCFYEIANFNAISPLLLFTLVT